MNRFPDDWPEAKREAGAHLVEHHEVSQRRACEVLQADRSMVRYQSKRSDDAELREAIKCVSAEHKRFGYRRVHVMIWSVLKTFQWKVLANKRAKPSSAKVFM